MPTSRKNRVKLQDIAQASGVSLTAVSLALSDKPGISQETRVRVLEVARQMGYRFKTPVSSTPTKLIKTIGLLVKSNPEDEPHANQFYSNIIAGIESTCRQMGVNLMFANLPVDNDNHPLEIPAILEKGEVDGVLLAGIFVNEALNRVLESRAWPIVLIDSYCDTRIYNSIVSDNIEGAYQAAEYLIRKGHRHIAFVGGHTQGYPSFNDRRIGYCNALAKHGITNTYLTDSSASRAEIAAAVLGLIEKNPQVTALLGVNDDTAITAMHVLMEKGVRVPQEISVIGFDDIYIAENVVPSLTTMHINKQSMGRLAVQLMINQTFQPDGGYVTSIFRPTLVERNSVAEVKQ